MWYKAGWKTQYSQRQLLKRYMAHFTFSPLLVLVRIYWETGISAVHKRVDKLTCLFPRLCKVAEISIAQVKVDKLCSPSTAQLLLAGPLESFNGKRLA